MVARTRARAGVLTQFRMKMCGKTVLMHSQCNFFGVTEDHEKVMNKALTTVAPA